MDERSSIVLPGLSFVRQSDFVTKPTATDAQIDSLLGGLLSATGAYRWVWHPALFDAALYVLLLYAISQLSLLL